MKALDRATAQPSEPSEPTDSGSSTGRRVLVVGAVALVAAFLVAAYIDYSGFDQTSGGYDPPYTDWTGTPIDWDEAEVTATGFQRNGLVLDDRLDCTTGMISFRVAKLFTFNFREVSARAIAVHEPREACRSAGFDPQF